MEVNEPDTWEPILLDNNYRFAAFDGVNNWYVERAEAIAAEEAETKPSPWRELWEGILLVWNTPRLLAIVWYAFLFNLTAFSITNGLLPYVARDVYHIDQTGLGWLIAFRLIQGVGAASVMVVPPPTGLEIVRVPPTAATRSCSPIRPEPHSASAPPLPSSLMVRSRRPSCETAAIVTTDASAYFAVLVSASATT